MSVKYPHVHVKLTGTDGNAFALIGRVSKALRQEVNHQAAAEFTADAMNSGSYDQLLVFIQSTVDVS
jgi:hypothetical protein